MGRDVKLAKWRKASGMTQRQLADALGCSQSHVSQIERRHQPLVPGRELMQRIFALTCGQVEANDFYDLPQQAQHKAAA